MKTAVLVVAAAAVGAWAQDAPLAGPNVSEAARATSLVQRDYEGRVRRLEVPPEEAALALLALDDASREATQRVLAERAAILDRLVLDNLPLLIRLRSAGAAGDRRAQAAIAAELFVKAEPLRARGSLRDQLAAALPEAQRPRFHALVDEYWDAVVAERRALGDRQGRLGILAGERLRVLGEEVARSFARQLDRRGEEEFERLLASLELRPDQEARVRRTAEEFIVGSKFRPSPGQQAMFVARVMSMLDERQRERLARHLAQQRDRDRAVPGP
jgi:hypothetical protein